jgi:ferrous iron transport protein A
MWENTLAHLKPGQHGVVRQISGAGSFKRRLVEMGITPGVTIFMRKVAPLGDPMEIHLRGYELTLRREDARRIMLEKER